MQVLVPAVALADSDTFTLTAASVHVPGVKLAALGTTIQLPWLKVYLLLLQE